MKYLYILPFLLLLFLSCTVASSEKGEELTIESINTQIISDQFPQESEYQVNIKLTASLSSSVDNNEDLYYEWEVNYLDIDVYNQIAIETHDASTDKIESKLKNNHHYFLEVSKSSTKALLSVYKEGYYQVIFRATNFINEEESSIILKIGNPEYPHLFLKTNIPPIPNANPEDFLGQIFININSSTNNTIQELKASDLQDIWYDTGIKLNPFSYFNISAGTHLVFKEDEEPHVLSFSNKLAKNRYSFVYSLNHSEESTPVLLSPIVLSNLKNKNHLDIFFNGEE
ncbi:MAG: hypothetical protein MJB14_14290, partial [Spirochaetes bacterium]|nr:hypothetical protein [Spirochaetota bacterium]